MNLIQLKSKIRIFLILMMLSILVKNATAQTDTEFWFAAPDVSNGGTNLDIPIMLRIASTGTAATVTVSIPAHIGFTPLTVSIPANGNANINLTDWITLIENSPTNTVNNKGLLITSTTPVSAYYEVVSGFCNCNPEIFALKGTNGLGTKFFTPFQNYLNNSTGYTPTPTASFEIVATENNTSVTITPTQNLLGGRTAGIPYTISLNRGQTYSGAAAGSSAAAHPIGTKIESNKPIAVTIKDDLLSGAPYGGCADLMGDQIVPVNKLGNNYIVLKGQLNGGTEKAFVVATEDNTVVSVNGTVVATLNAGGNYTVTFSSSSVSATATKPVYVLHMSGFGCEVGGALLPSIICSGSDQINVVRSTSETFILNLLVRNGAQNNFLFNGATGVINGTSFYVVPNTSNQWAAAQITLSTSQLAASGTARISNTTDLFQLGIIHGGSTSGTRYGYFSNFSTANVIASSNTPVSAGSSINLTSTAGFSTYAWTGPNGFTASSQNPSLSNALPINAGSYGVTVTNNAGCIGTSSTNVTVNTTPGAALNFDGVNDYATVSGINIANQSFTFECWAKANAINRDNILAGQGPINNNTGLHIGFRPNNTFTFAFYNNDLNTAAPYTDNNWHHWACVYSVEGTVRTRSIYRDGQLVAQDNPTANFQGSGAFYIGKHDWGANFQGNIDEVRVWNRALCQGEIQNGMNCEIPTSGNGLLANYHFNQGTAMINNSIVNTLTDASGNGRTGTLVNFGLNGATSNWTAPGGVVSGTSCANFTPPAISATNNGPLNAGSTLNLTATAGFSAYAWTGPNGFTASSQNPSVNNVTTAASGTYTVRGTASNGCRNTTTTNVSVVCSPPTVSNCPQTQYQQIYTTSANCGAAFTYSPTIGGTTPTITYTFSGATTATGNGTGSGATFNPGQTTVTVNATNACGTASCSFVVTVIDNIIPAMLTKNKTVYLNASGNASVTTTDINNGSNDNCGPVSLSLANNGTICGSATENQSLTLTAPPGAVITGITFASYGTPTGNCGSFVQGWCHSSISKSYVESIALGQNSVTIAATNGNFGDPCGGTVKRLYVQATWAGVGTPGTYTCTNLGANNLILVGTDINGNVATANATVTVIDSIKPVITCPTHISVNATSASGATVNYTTPTATDNCTATVSRTAGLASGSIFPIGTSTVTHRAADASGNFVECSFTVTVVGVAPVLVSPGYIFAVTEPGICSSVVNFSVIDSTGIPASTITYSHAPGSTFQRGNTIVTVTATNPIGSSSIYLIVAVADNQPPIAIAKDITIQLDANGKASLSPTQIDNGSSDNCGIASMSLSKSEFDCTNIGVNMVVLTVTTNFGDKATDTAFVTVAGSNLPILTATSNSPICNGADLNLTASNISLGGVSLNAGFNSSTLDNGLNLSSSTNGDFITGVAGTGGMAGQFIARRNYSGLGRQLRQYIRTDINNFKIRDFTFDVRYEQVNINSVSNIVFIGIGDGLFGTFGPGEPSNALYIRLHPEPLKSSDGIGLTNNGAFTGLTAVSGIGVGVHIIRVVKTGNEVRFYKKSGTATTFTQIGGVYDLSTAAYAHLNNSNTRLFVGTESNNIQFDYFTVTSSSSAYSWTGPNGFSANTQNVSLNNFNAATQAGTYNLTVNSNGCIFNASTNVVGDTVAPIASAQNLTLQLDANGNASTTATAVNNGSSDNCAVSSLTLSKSNFTCSDLGANTVTLTVTDNNNNASTASATITVEDKIVPNISCGNNISLLATSAAGVVVNYSTPTATDNCAATVTRTAGPASGSTFPIGITTLTHSATDASGNTTSCSFTVNVTGLPPVIVSPGTIQSNTDANACNAVVTFAATETTGIPASTITYSHAPGSVFPLGTTTVTATATNPVGVSTTTFDVVVTDNQAPNALAKNLSVALNANGQASITAAQVNDGSSDACGIKSMTVSPAAFTCANVGANNVTLTVTDNNNNVSTATSTITISDVTAPVASAKNLSVNLDASGNASITAAQVNDGSSDACGIKSMTVSPAAFTCANVGANNVTLTVTDNNNNVSTATATVTISDVTAPVASAKNLSVNLDASGNASITAVQVNDGSSDACGIKSMTVSPAAFTCANVGANNVTLTVTDNNNNVSTATATVTISDVTAPVASAKNLSVNLDASGNASITAAQVNDGSSDACGIKSMTVSPAAFTCANVGANNVTLTVTDNNNNVSTATATVTISDVTAPVVLTKNISVTLSGGAASITATQIDNGSNDACGIKSISVSPSSFNCGNIGANTVTLTVVDNNNNVSTGSATVTVNGVIPSCSILSAPRNNGTVIGSTNTLAATNQMFLGYGAQSMNINCSAIGGGPFTYSWSGTGLSSTTIANPIFTPTAGGNYTLTCNVTNSFGCQTTCSIVICVIDVRAPGGSPNNPKVLLCHVPPGNPNNTQTLSISVNAVPAHLGLHGGDRLGNCNAACGMSKTDNVIGEIYTEEKDFSDIDLIVYPNPSNGVFNFKLESSSEETVSIRFFDMSGRMVAEVNNQSPKDIIIWGADMTTGVYMAEVTQGSFRKTVKVTKTNN